MKFMILVKSNPALERGIESMPKAELQDSMKKMEVFNDELRKAGIVKDCSAA